MFRSLLLALFVLVAALQSAWGEPGDANWIPHMFSSFLNTFAEIFWSIEHTMHGLQGFGALLTAEEGVGADCCLCSSGKTMQVSASV
jgi:hypothetical protein